MNRPGVLISIVCYNSSRFIVGCLDAVLKQSFQNFLVVVYDNHSSDDTAAIVRRYEDTRIAYEQGNENIGFGAAHNWVINHYDSDFVLLLNPDAFLEEQFLEKALGGFAADPSVGSVAGLLFADNADDPVVDCAGMTFTRSRRFKLRFTGLTLTSAAPVSQLVDGVDGAVAMYRRDAVNSILVNDELFDRSYFLYGEDWDVAWRLQLVGWRCMFVAEARALHYRLFKQRSFADRKKISREVKYHSLKNSIASVIKNDDSYNFFRDFLFISKRFLLVVAYSLVFEFYSLKALPYILAHFRGLLRIRRVVQSKRKVPPGRLRSVFILGPREGV